MRGTEEEFIFGIQNMILLQQCNENLKQANIWPIFIVV